MNRSLTRRIAEVDSVLDCVGEYESTVGRHDTRRKWVAAPPLSRFPFYRPQAIEGGSMEG